jgi:hypothetical protein
MKKFKLLVWVNAIVLALLFSLAGCSQIDQVKLERDFTTTDLLLPVEKMPPGWEVVGDGPGPMLANEGGPDDSSVIFKPITEQYNTTRHFVWHYGSLAGAEKWHDHRFRSEFNSNSIAVDEPWLVPGGWTFSSLNADKFHAACTINNIAGPKRVCTAMWQYDEFVAVFASSIRPEYGMTVEQFEVLVKEIDQIMAAHLDK